jgi:hypothetical protein
MLGTGVTAVSSAAARHSGILMRINERFVTKFWYILATVKPADMLNSAGKCKSANIARLPARVAIGLPGRSEA